MGSASGSEDDDAMSSPSSSCAGFLDSGLRDCGKEIEFHNLQGIPIFQGFPIFQEPQSFRSMLRIDI